jgi:hypothetical protein
MKITLMSLNVHPRAFAEAVANAKRTRRRIEDELNGKWKHLNLFIARRSNY